MASWISIIIAVITSIIASGGFWAYLQKRYERRDAKTKMILGLGYDRIITLGMSYVNRGWITQDEYENLEKYIYEPYSKLRPDDGSVRKVMQAVDQLPIVDRRKMVPLG